MPAKLKVRDRAGFVSTSVQVPLMAPDALLIASVARAGLPLLQFTLLKLWQQRRRNRITQDVYQQVGNPRQALERSAEALYTSLIPEEQQTMSRARYLIIKEIAHVTKLSIEEVEQMIDDALAGKKAKTKKLAA